MPKRCRHQYVLNDWRGFGNEFSIYTVPADWEVKQLDYDPERCPKEQRTIPLREAIDRMRAWRGAAGRRVVYRCPICGYTPKGLIEGEVE